MVPSQGLQTADAHVGWAGNEMGGVDLLATVSIQSMFALYDQDSHRLTAAEKRV